MTNTSFKPVRKAVFPVAGLGTRFLPATKVIPKEMITVGDRPLIQHTVEEAMEAGIEEIIFITGRNKEALIEHFDYNAELTSTLEARGKKDILKKLEATNMRDAKLFTTRQSHPLGLGHAVWCAKKLVGNEPFAVILPDVVVDTRGGRGCLGQLMDAYNEHGGNIIAVNEVPREETNKYGVIDIAGEDGNLFSIKGMVEKPKPENAPSNLSVTGRYILQPEVFDHLSAFERGAGDEIQLTDSMVKLIGKQPFHALKFKGDVHDCGHPLGFAVANAAFALGNPAISSEFRKIMEGLLAPSP